MLSRYTARHFKVVKASHHIRPPLSGISTYLLFYLYLVYLPTIKTQLRNKI